VAKCGDRSGRRASRRDPARRLTGIALVAAVVAACGESGANHGETCRTLTDLLQSTSNVSAMTKEDFNKIQDITTNILRSKVPNEIKSDVQTYGKAYAPLRAVYEKYNFDGAKVRAALPTDLDVPKALEALSSSSMWQAAATRLLTYQQQNCAPNG